MRISLPDAPLASPSARPSFLLLYLAADEFVCFPREEKKRDGKEGRKEGRQKKVL